jgi:hypothetical protein
LYRQTYRQNDRQTIRLTDRQADSKIDRQKEIRDRKKLNNKTDRHAEADRLTIEEK